MKPAAARYLARVFISLSLILAPLCFLVGQALESWVGQPLAGGDPTGWFVQHVLLYIGVALLLPATHGLVQLLGPREAWFRLVGSSLVALGVLANISIFALDFAAGEMATAGDQAVMIALFQRILRNPAITVLLSLQATLALGLGILAIGLYRSSTVPKWAPISIGLGVISQALVLILGDAAQIIPSALSFAGLATIGWIVLKQPSQQWERF